MTDAIEMHVPKKNDEHAENGNKRIHFFMWDDDEHFERTRSRAFSHRHSITITIQCVYYLALAITYCNMSFATQHTHVKHTSFSVNCIIFHSFMLFTIRAVFLLVYTFF